MKAIQKILVIDDESDVGEFVSAAADAMGFKCTATTDAKTFLEALTPDTTLILLDLLMPDMDGIELLRLLGERKCKAGIVLVSGVGKRVMETAGQLAQVLGLNILGHLQKPFRLAELEEVLKQHAAPEALQPAKQGPQIGNHVFLGDGAKVVGNVKVGDNAIIGVSSVVTKDIPANATAVGIPAKVIKEHNDRSTQQ